MWVSLRSEEGWTLVEMAVAAAVSLVVLGLIGSSLVVGMRTVRIGSDRSSALQDARLVLNQIQRDLRGSNGFQLCQVTASQPAGSCAVVLVQAPSSTPSSPPPDQTVRWRVEDQALYRELDDGSGNFPVRSRALDRLANLGQDPPVALFECTAGGSLLQVGVTLIVRAIDPGDSPYMVSTVVRPRNTYQPAGC